jgi:response regulator RpfG family c-di-GMP phosphodiesterase
MSEKVLFVDDEPPVLEGFQRLLRREFAVETAVGGEQGLAKIAVEGPFALVVSDMRMPGMDGVQFLSKVKQVAPDTVRMVLTGQADIHAAMNAVNEGNIFRFLTKPCDKETLSKAITTGLVQYRLVVAEKSLLEDTLMGSIKVLTDVLSLVNPAAFGRSVRITRYVRHMVVKLGVESPWRYEIAAMLSQLGCVALHPDVIEAAYAGNTLPEEEQKRFDAHPQMARDLLINIPRLEPTAWMIGQQSACKVDARLPEATGLPRETLVLGAKMLRLAITFDNLKMKGASQEEIVAYFRHDASRFDSALVDALVDLEPEVGSMELRAVPISKLTSGMILQQEVRTHSGLLVVTKGQEVTYPLMVKLGNFSQRHAIDDMLMVLVPAERMERP